MKFAGRSERAGLTREQASAIAEAQKEALSEALGTSRATKIDSAEVKAELAVLKWMLGVVIAIAVANFAKQFF
ncbi:MAG: hypothetical protein K9K38_08065 [Rhodoferax sp.]|nr:hypothetical protein [Rhodoferax sp.]MCF8209341.1 hypothetical protein [Rhodoferax sp.]